MSLSTKIRASRSLSKFCKFATHTINCPGMGDSISEGTVKEYMKNVGDKLEPGDIVAQIETDKITIEIPCEQKGYLKQWHVPVEEIVEVGEPLFDVDDEPVTAEEGTQSATPAASNSETDFLGRTIKKETLSRLRQTVAGRLKAAQNNAAMLTTFNEVNMKPIMDLRKKNGEAFMKKQGIKLGFMSLFMKACTLALNEFSEINSYLDESGKVIMKPEFVDISVAVASPTGLVVPVVRDCDDQSLADYESNLAELATKAREGKISMQDMQGGTFTISNGGVFGSLMGTPIINPPQSAILGMHGTQQRPVVENGQIVARPMMYLALTYDHRIVDGKGAVLFLKTVKNYIENPETMGIEGDM